MSRFKVVLIEPNHVTTRDQYGRVLGSIRDRIPLHSQPIIASILRKSSLDLSIEIYNPTLMPRTETLFKESKVGGLDLRHFARGETWESESFKGIAQSADLLGITVNFTERAGVALLIAKQARKWNPGVKIVFGGSDAFHRPLVYLGDGVGDVVVPKDAELIGHKVVDALLGGGRIGDVPGIIYREGRHILHTPGGEGLRLSDRFREPVLPALDLVVEQIPFWQEDHEGPLPQGVSPPISYMEMSRGCHERCSFCTTAGISYSYMLPDSVQKYAEHLKKYGISAVNIIDDNVLTRLLVGKGKGRSDLLDTFSVLRESGMKWCFGNGLQFSLLRDKIGKLDEEIVDALFNSCYCTFLPLEDVPTPAMPVKYRKLLGFQGGRCEARDAFEVFRSNAEIIEAIAGGGVPRMTFGFIIGYPGDSVERARRVVEPLSWLRRRLQEVNPRLEQLYMVHNWMALPGTVDFNSDGAMNALAQENPEFVQFAIGSGGGLWIEERLQLVEALNGEKTLKEWLEGRYPRGTSLNG